MIRTVFLTGVFLSGVASALAEERVKQPSFLPKNEVYYSTECAEPFTGWVDPLNAHLTVIASSMAFRSSPTADADLNQCVSNTAIWMTMSGLTEKPVRFELMDNTGKVLLAQTLNFGG